MQEKWATLQADRCLALHANLTSISILNDFNICFIYRNLFSSYFLNSCLILDFILDLTPAVRTIESSTISNSCSWGCPALPALGRKPMETPDNQFAKFFRVFEMVAHSKSSGIWPPWSWHAMLASDAKNAARERERDLDIFQKKQSYYAQVARSVDQAHLTSPKVQVNSSMVHRDAILNHVQ